MHQTEYGNDHDDYMQMEPAENSSSSHSNKNYSDNLSRTSHVSDPTHSDRDPTHSDPDPTLGARRSNSVDFTKKHDEDRLSSRSCFTPIALRRTCKTDNMNGGLQYKKLEIVESKDRLFKGSESRTENTLVAKFRDAVKIRRSSSVPSKSEKNRDSSSSNDSGVSTGSLKHHKGKARFVTCDVIAMLSNRFTVQSLLNGYHCEFRPYHPFRHEKLQYRIFIPRDIS